MIEQNRTSYLTLRRQQLLTMMLRSMLSFMTGRLVLRTLGLAAWAFCLFVLFGGCSGCKAIQRQKPAAETTRVIALPEESTVKSLKAGDMVPFDGFLVGKARFVQLMPCFRDELTGAKEKIEPTPDPISTNARD